MPQNVVCDMCGRPLPPHAHYVVRIDVFADPSVPPTTHEQMQSTDYEHEMAQLMKLMEGMSAEQLQDQVHRRFEYRICRPCQARFLANPLGKPRAPAPSSVN